MRNTIGKLCAIIATLVLLFSVAFFTVSQILKDNDYIEQKYKELGVSAQMGMSTPDLSRATTALLDYMRGERANIRVEARVNGADLPDVFWHEKEVVHMAEVQSLYLGLESFAKYGAVGAAVLLLVGFLLMERGKRRALLSSAMFWGTGIFGGVLVFFGIWSILDFSSFWTVFHFIIFPSSLFQYLSAGATVEAMNDLNWVLSSDSIMVNMLMPIFPSLVLRCAVGVVLEIVVVAIAALLVRFAWRKQGKPSPVADIVVIEHDENEPMPIEGPDLVLAHKLRNIPVNKREALLKKAKGEEEHLISPLTGTASPQGEASEKDVDQKPSSQGEASVEDVDQKPSSQGEASEEDADQKPSPRGEGVSQSETDEVSISNPSEDAQ